MTKRLHRVAPLAVESRDYDQGVSSDFQTTTRQRVLAPGNETVVMEITAVVLRMCIENVVPVLASL